MFTIAVQRSKIHWCGKAKKTCQNIPDRAYNSYRKNLNGVRYKLTPAIERRK